MRASLTPQQVESSLQKGNTYLNLYNQSIEVVPPTVFRNEKLTSLTYLNLGGNQIQSIPPETFDFLTNLKILYLHNNKLNHFSPQLLKKLTNLVELSLDSNNLKAIPPVTFGGLTTLSRLYLDVELCTMYKHIKGTRLTQDSLKLLNGYDQRVVTILFLEFGPLFKLPIEVVRQIASFLCLL